MKIFLKNQNTQRMSHECALPRFNFQISSIENIGTIGQITNRLSTQFSGQIDHANAATQNFVDHVIPDGFGDSVHNLRSRRNDHITASIERIIAPDEIYDDHQMNEFIPNENQHFIGDDL